MSAEITVGQQPEKKKKGRKKVESYAPKELHLCLFKILMAMVYRNRYQRSINDTTVIYDKRLFEKSEDDEGPFSDPLFSGKIKPFEYMIHVGDGNEDGQEISDYYFRTLNMEEIAEYLFKHGRDTLFKDVPENKWEEKKEKVKSTFYKTLNEFTDKKKGYFVKSLVDGRKLYYPNESPRAFKRFANMLYSVTKGNIEEKYEFLFKTHYFRSCLTKQFVLDHLRMILWDKGQCLISMEMPMKYPLSEYDVPKEILENVTDVSLRYRIPLPLVGRYPKVYEDKSTDLEFARFVRLVEEYCFTSDMISADILENHFFGKEVEEKSRTIKVTGEIREQLKMTADRICSDLEYDSRIKERLDYILNHYEDALDRDITDTGEYDTNVVDVFNADPDGTYRNEDSWAQIVLTKDDEKTLREGSEIDISMTYERPYEGELEENEISSNIIKNTPIPSRERDYDDLIDSYPQIVDCFVTPLLSLIRFSPNALFYFLFEEKEWLRECTGESDNDRLFYGNAAPRLFDVNILVEKLTKIALKDYMNEMYVNSPYNSTRCIHVGSRIDGEQHFPSVLTFGLGEKNVMALAWSENIPKESLRSEPAFTPYFDGLPCYSQRTLDIVKMVPSGRVHFFKDFLIKALKEYGAEWKKVCDDQCDC